MRYIPAPIPSSLPNRWVLLASKRISALELLKTHKERSDYLKKYNSWAVLKTWLADISAQKCWYCEAKSFRAPYDVDHFRPKLNTTVLRVEIGHNGYSWLAYKWDNFRLSCQRCNRPEKDNDILHGKANEFALRVESNRCKTSVGKLSDEEPKLLDPCCEADIALLAYGLDGEVKPAAAQGTWEYERAYYTIDVLGLNDFRVPEEKKKKWRALADSIEIINNPSISLPDRVKQSILKRLEDHIDSSHEYSSFFRSVVGTHRDKEWVDEMLKRVKP
jgi:uncharacterized protein (TIGR02646 family)